VKQTSKWITVAAALGLSASLAIAGTGHGHGGFNGKGHGERGMKLASKLNLTDAQKEQWKAIRKSSHEQNSTFFQQSRQTMQDFRAAKQAGDTAKMDTLKSTMQSQRAQMKQIRDAEEAQVLNILTAEQRTQYQTLKAQRAEKGKGWQK
jgi:Spy/CpxP family protein refolding chaperone